MHWVVTCDGNNLFSKAKVAQGPTDTCKRVTAHQFAQVMYYCSYRY